MNRQHGVVARRQLLEMGLGARQIERRIATGRLHPVWRGVYAVGRPQLSRLGRWMAAALACGPEAVLSHDSAAALWGFGAESQGLIEVSVPAAIRRRHAGIRVHRRTALLPEELTAHEGVPVTGPARTLIDEATRLRPMQLERAVNEADKLDRVDPETLRAALERHGGQPGVALLRAILDRRTFRLSDSDLELRFRPLARAAGLPEPETKARVNGFEVDFNWPELGIVVETDGLRYHRTPSQQTRGLLRDQAHVASGLLPLRFSHAQIRFEPGYARARLRQTAALARKRGD
ncbi:MAG TPA: type IV toxin-antitoxin system AbiEi family antitoxin domain-containing protein [Solirubrobacterales bacterium]|nr:type IV toxin-antitoxin system AbiEi family antitoxin domain-containing protein [Solirubrobacterales bacterium]